MNELWRLYSQAGGDGRRLECVIAPWEPSEERMREPWAVRNAERLNVQMDAQVLERVMALLAQRPRKLRNPRPRRMRR